MGDLQVCTRNFFESKNVFIKGQRVINCSNIMGKENNLGVILKGNQIVWDSFVKRGTM